MEEVKSNGGTLYVFERNLYKRDRLKPNGTWNLHCTRDGCQVRLIKDPTGGISYGRYKNGHSHEDNIAEIAKKRMKMEINEEAKKKPTKSINKILDDKGKDAIKFLIDSGFDRDEATVIIPDLKNVETTAYRHRQQVIPRQPKDRQSLLIEGEWAEVEEMAKTRRFLLVQDGEEDKIIVFITDKFLGLLCNAKTIFMDGTFFVSPTIFSQLFTIHGLYRGKMICFLYALLPDKSFETYRRLFRIIQDFAAAKDLVFNPKAAQSDFESGIIKALHNIFPNIKLRNCHFHYAQAIMKRVRKSEELRNKYSRNPNFRRLIRRLICLALVPLDCQEELLAASLRGIVITESVRIFLLYYWNTWFSDSARFPRNIWNHYQDFAARTNNHIEGFHCGLNAVVKVAHPNIFRLITILKRKHSRYYIRYMKLKNGCRTSLGNSVYRKMNEAYIRICENYEASDKTAADKSTMFRAITANLPGSSI